MTSEELYYGGLMQLFAVYFVIMVAGFSAVFSYQDLRITELNVNIGTKKLKNLCGI